MIWTIIAAMVGWAVGYFTAALCAAGKIRDMQERMHFMARRD